MSRSPDHSALPRGLGAPTHQTLIFGVVVLQPGRPDQVLRGVKLDLLIARLQDPEKIVETRVGLVSQNRRHTPYSRRHQQN